MAGYSSSTDYTKGSGGGKPAPGSSQNMQKPGTGGNVGPSKAPSILSLDDSDKRSMSRTVPTVGRGGKLHNHTISWLAGQPAVKGYDVGGLQQKLKAAGVLGDNYVNGVYDDPTRKAYLYVLGIASIQQVSFDEALKLVGSSPVGAKGRGGGGGAAPKNPIRLTDPLAIADAVDKVAPSLLGRTFTDAEKQAIVAGFHALESQFQHTMDAGGTASDPDLGSYIQQQAKQLHPEEAETFKKFNLASDAMRLLGIGGQVTGG